MTELILRFTGDFVVRRPEPAHHHRTSAAIAAHDNFPGLFIDQRNDKTKNINEDKYMPVHQLNGLACQRPFT